MLTIDFKQLALSPNARVLDIGCGEGRHIIAAGQHPQTRCVGADYVFENLAETKKKIAFHRSFNDLSCRSMDLSCMDITCLPFEDNSLDCVICSEVLEHIPDDTRAMQELLRIVKPGRSLAVSVPRFLPEKICWLLSKEYPHQDMGHIRIYKKDALIKKMESLGATFLSSHYAHSIHSPYWWLKCLVGLENSRHLLVDAYHRLLVWDLMKQPRITRCIDQALNPLIGKSLVLYFKTC